MLFLNLTLRHLRRHWRLNLAVLLGLTLAAALLAGLPGYATAIAARSLYQDLDEASPSVRNLQVSGGSYLMGAGLYGRLQEGLGELIASRVEVRDIELRADPPRPTEQVDGEGRVLRALHIWSFDKLPSSVRVVAGRLPAPADPRDATNPLKPPPIEAVIGVEATGLTGWAIGDRMTARDKFFAFDIVGIVQPLAPDADMWGADLTAFDILVDTSDPNVDYITLSLLIASSSMQDFVPQHQVSWRVPVNRDYITVDNVEAVHSDLINLQTKLGTNRARISTGLVKILADYLARLSRVRMSLFLLTTQGFIFVLYTLAMLSSFLLDRSRGELAMLSGRGATAFQITMFFALESLVLALPAALLLGPSLARGTLALWAKLAGASIPVGISPESRLLASIAGGCGWLAFVLPVYPAARRNLLAWQQTRARPARLSTAQSLYLDLFLLTLGGLLYWQLNQAGSFVMHRLGDTALADPLLLLGPSLLLISVAMVFLRLAPYLLRSVAWMSRRVRGLMLPLGLARLARDPLKPSRVVLLTSMAASLILFTSVFGDSLAHAQQEMARYFAGADLRVSLSRPADLNVEALAALPGVSIVSHVFRTVVQTDQGHGIQLLAVDPATLDRVTRYPRGFTSVTVSAITSVVQGNANDEAMPAVFSYDALPSGTAVGDQLWLTTSGRRLAVRAQGTINNFPTLSGAFVIVSLPALEKQIDLDASAGHPFQLREAWLGVEPAHLASLADRPELEGRILGDVLAHRRSLQADALAQGTTGAFQLSALTLALLSVSGFLLVHLITAQQRVMEFSVLRALGLTARQLFTLLATEGVLVMVLGLVAGTVIGFGLAHIMVPYLSRALSASLAGTTIGQIIVDWSAVIRLYAVLVGFYALATLLLLLALMRVGVQRALRIGDE